MPVELFSSFCSGGPRRIGGFIGGLLIKGLGAGNCGSGMVMRFPRPAVEARDLGGAAFWSLLLFFPWPTVVARRER
jgi:hypothetical protein